MKEKPTPTAVKAMALDSMHKKVIETFEEEYCPCGRPVTGDYGICSSPQCK
jgi:hypothetical protein